MANQKETGADTRSVRKHAPGCYRMSSHAPTCSTQIHYDGPCNCGADDNFHRRVARLVNEAHTSIGLAHDALQGPATRHMLFERGLGALAKLTTLVEGEIAKNKAQLLSSDKGDDRG